MEETISLQEIFDVIKNRLKLIILITIGATIIAAVASFFLITPIYQSSAQFIVNQSNMSDDQLNQSAIRTNVELINTYKEIITSQAILNDVAAQLEADIAANQLAGKINVSSAQNSQVVNITVKDKDPQLATAIANTTMYVFQEKMPELMNVDNVHVLSEAVDQANPSPVSPNKKLNIAIGFVLGAMVGIGLAFLLEYLDTTIHAEEDIAKHLELPILGVISTVEQEDIIRPKTTRRSEA